LTSKRQMKIMLRWMKEKQRPQEHAAEAEEGAKR
jgi:hypothetical protein